MGITATIITLNEEKNIGACLASLNFVDEIIVVDSGSTDRTEEICRSNPRVKFFNQPWLGFGPQKNYAVSLASHTWIISVDADEVVTPELAAEIQATIHDGCDLAGCWVQRKNMYKKQWIKHGGWWPDEVLRVFRKDKGRFNDRRVHESVEIDGTTARLQAALEHYSYSGPEDFILKMHSYAMAGAYQMQEDGRAGGAVRAVIRAIAAFVKGYILKQGFLDGRAGLLIATSGAIGVFYKIIKLSELNERP
ncbi:MAG: glycosyltransferase family 2 protein [Trichlorobacter sp.]|uniref:glycosyltransferase family 2 protein n=1 Tax=Trichlorobacter sp. TaxID=2911007 RepID=UPI002560EB98|nr:glycosyltransferase family 2 protein [Trichlorobacter sp.]MDK9718419.1 glycosyltransferase family 2 protein [Trichlorobacter sp.]